MKHHLLSVLLLAVASSAAAQTAPPASTSDGAVRIEREGAAGSVPATQAPIVVVSGDKLNATSRANTSSGNVEVGAVNSGQRRSTALNPTAGGVGLGTSTASQPATVVRQGAVTRWTPQTQACPQYYDGSISWEREERQTVVSGWTPTGAQRNYANACVAQVATRWVPRNSACASGYSGSNTWEAEQASTAGGPYADTGNTRAHASSCAAIVTTRWVGRNAACAVGYAGSNTWEAEQQSTAGGPYADTGATRNHVNTCAATVDTRWVGRSAACPAGYGGSNTWEAQQTSTAGGPYTDTGATRNHVNTCAPLVRPEYKATGRQCHSYSGQYTSNQTICDNQEDWDGSKWMALAQYSPGVIDGGKPMCDRGDYPPGPSGGYCVESISSPPVPATCSPGQRYTFEFQSVSYNNGTSGWDADMDRQNGLIEYLCQ